LPKKGFKTITVNDKLFGDIKQHCESHQLSIAQFLEMVMDGNPPRGQTYE